MLVEWIDTEDAWYVMNMNKKLIAGPFECDEEAKEWISKFIQYN